ncbi:MAG TPA: Smr/MutS family protein [Azospirillaceae bacterium]|nr:Smr/MutS family protein [Azospirillaceae bacterium]
MNPPIRPSSRRQRQPTPEELKLWHEAMRDAVPLERARPRPKAPVPPDPPAPSPGPVAKPVSIPAPADAAARITRMPPLPDLDPAGVPGLDRRTADRLRKGKVELRGRIDLHGMTQAQAHAALVSFILRCWNEDRRTVLVITGKGSVGEGGGVLRRAVPRWLNEPPLRERILGINEAAQRDGGVGALYVLLKRRRDAGGPRNGPGGRL